MVPHLTANLVFRDRAMITTELEATEARQVGDVLCFYNHGNGHNLVALTALLQAHRNSQVQRPADGATSLAGAAALDRTMSNSSRFC